MNYPERFEECADAIESWSFADKHRMPDYLYERIDTAIDLLRKDLIG